MGLLDAHADTIEANARRDLASPGPAPEPSFNMASFLAAGFKAPVAGVLDRVAGIGDLNRNMGAAFPSVLDNLSPEDRAYEQKRRAQTQASLDSWGSATRKKADEFMPDPVTAHWSTQTVAGFTRFATKAVADVATMGPVAGTAVLGLDEANNTSQRLQAKGVDPSTAWQVGGVTGVLSAAGAVMPMAGGTIAKTAGLVALGGPLSFMAQEGLSREILQKAGYDEEAKGHDPFDPMGLGISTAAALLFGGIGYRGARAKAKPIEPPKTEADVKSAVQLSPAEQAASDAFERSTANLNELRAAIAAEKRPEARALLEQELATQEKAAATTTRGTAADLAAADPAAVDAARVALLDETLVRSLPKDEPSAYAMVQKALDQVAAGQKVDVGATRVETLSEFMERNRIKDEAGPPAVSSDFIGFLQRAGGIDMRAKYDLTGERSGVLSNPGGVFRKGGMGLDELAIRAEEAGYLKPGQGQESRLMADLIQNAIRGDHPLTLEQQGAYAARDHHITTMAERRAAAEQRLQKLGIDPEQAGGNVKAMEAYLAEHEHRLVAAELEDAAGPVRVANTMESLPEPPPSRAAASVERARVAMQDLHDTDKPLAEFVRDGNLPPDVQNLVVGMHKLDQAGRERLLSDFDRAANSNRSAPLMDIAADVVEGKIKPADEPDAMSTAAMMLAEQKPDLPVTLPGDEKPTTLAAAMERIKSEQEAEVQFGELVRVAAQCALTGGAAI